MICDHHTHFLFLPHSLATPTYKLRTPPPAMAEDSLLYDVIPHHTASPRRARTLNRPPGYRGTSKPPTPPPPRFIPVPPIPPRNKMSGEDDRGMSSSFPYSSASFNERLGPRTKSTSSTNGEWCLLDHMFLLKGGSFKTETEVLLRC